MYSLSLNNSKKSTLSVDFNAGHIASLIINDKERLSSLSPLFKIRFRDIQGKSIVIDTYNAKSCVEQKDGATYTDFDNDIRASVTVTVTQKNGEITWGISIIPENDSVFVEWVDFPLVSLPLLEKNNARDNGGKILIPYNEGALISDAHCREEGGLCYQEPEYPSKGSFYLFPNMVSSQMMAYLWNDVGLYVGAHDPKRGVKGIDFIPDNNGVTLKLRLFCGKNFGEKYSTEFPIVWSLTSGCWESAAERYRNWFASHLPANVKKIRDNDKLPKWHRDSPLIVSYPVRGRYDTDEMSANKLYPYTNALPILDDIKKRTNSELLVLLMHWEGTAPWAPPYVWPPYGDCDNFNEFMKRLHQNGDRLGVYCSGFGYTIKSNLTDDYECQKEYEEKQLHRGMCAAPDGKVYISNICQNQRVGYDICPASELGKEILHEAYKPLFENDLDYVQILDQNHGGGQYFCYSREHGHPPAPGEWMTENMQEMLTSWNKMAPKTLFGCESAAAEPFIGNLQFSDNRFELNYRIGEPVPLYAYIYHEYVRNFMGNQVSCPFSMKEDSLRFRIAYAFAAGDCMTVILTPDGDIMSHWGMKDFSFLPDKDKALLFIKNLTAFYKNSAYKYLYSGRMIPADHVECPSVVFGRRDSERTINLPTVYTSAWEADDGTRAQILINPTEHDVKCKINGKETTVPALDAILI